jgi:galactokinase
MEKLTGPEFLLREFSRDFEGKPSLHRAPGRFNVIGEHTDYNGGWVLPATLDLFTWVAAAPREGSTIRLRLCDEGSRYAFECERIERGEPGQAEEYVKGVAWALREEGVKLGACDLAISGNIPIGGGLSSSASLEIAVADALTTCSGVDLERGRMARICQRAEAEFVGVQCGIMDQYVIALGNSLQAMKLDCRTLDYDLVDLPGQSRFLVVHSGVRRSLQAGDYNSRRQECAEAVKRLQSVFPGLEQLRDLTMDQLLEHAGLLSEPLFRRCRHVLSENQRVHEAALALAGGDTPWLGELLSQSHRSLRDDYEVSCRELDRLVDISGACDGVLGSRLMGAGFGGCTINLVEADKVEQVARTIERRYGRELGRTPWMHIVSREADER